MIKRFEKREIKTEPPFDKYVGAYVRISNVHGSFEAGMFLGFINGYALLGPFLTNEYTSKDGLVKKLKDDVMLVNMLPNTSLEPTTKKEILTYCEFQNEEFQKKRSIEQDKKK